MDKVLSLQIPMEKSRTPAPFKDTLQIYEGALMDQEGLKDAAFSKALAVCF